MSILSGKLIINEFGNAFVNSQQITVYIPKNKIGHAINLDTVQVKYEQMDDGKFTGEVINYSILNKKFVGFVHHTYQSDVFISVPELRKKMVAIQTFVYLQKSNWVEVVITDESSEQLKGELTKTFLNPTVDELIEHKFKCKNIDETEEIVYKPAIYLEMENQAKNIIKRVDLRDHDVFTVDPPDCRDCDDAFSIKVIDGIKHIYVHIADVSHYINPDHPDFEDIIKRGNTIYGKTKSWTMIPEKYAHDICSILPDKETYVITTEYSMNDDLSLVYVGTYESVIIPKNKYTYEYADEHIGEEPFQTIFKTSFWIQKHIPDFVLNDESYSHKMIKYWMIYVNETMCINAKSNIIYRVNSEPSKQRLELIHRALQHFYYEHYCFWHFKKKIDPKNLEERHNLTTFIVDIEKIPVVSYLIEHFIPKAYYQTQNGYHYGLGIDNYCHWTSPIRRAADLLNQCIWKGYNIDINKYIEYLNCGEILQNSVEDFIREFENLEKFTSETFITRATIVNVFEQGIQVYIDSLNEKYTIHVSKLLCENLMYDDYFKSLWNSDYKFNLFDTPNVIVRKENQKIEVEVYELDELYFGD